MFKSEKSIIVIMIIIALIIFFAFMVKTVYEQRDKYNVNNNQSTSDYKMYGFISNNSVDSTKMKGIYQRVGNKLKDKIDFEIINVSETNTLSNKYKVHVVPSVLILDKYGNVVKRHNGLLEYEQVLDMVNKVIQK